MKLAPFAVTTTLVLFATTTVAIPQAAVPADSAVIAADPVEGATVNAEAGAANVKRWRGNAWDNWDACDPFTVITMGRRGVGLDRREMNDIKQCLTKRPKGGLRSKMRRWASNAWDAWSKGESSDTASMRDHYHEHDHDYHHEGTEHDMEHRLTAEHGRLRRTPDNKIWDAVEKSIHDHKEHEKHKNNEHKKPEGHKDGHKKGKKEEEHAKRSEEDEAHRHVPQNLKGEIPYLPEQHGKGEGEHGKHGKHGEHVEKEGFPNAKGEIKKED